MFNVITFRTTVLYIYQKTIPKHGKGRGIKKKMYNYFPLFHCLQS